MVAVVGLGVDHAKDALPVCAEGLAGCAVAGVASHPEFVEVGDITVPALPFTNLSKSISGSSDGPLLIANAFGAPKDMKSSFPDAFPLDPPNSCSFRVCSDSTLVESVLMSSMKDLNWVRSRSGPRLMLQRTGRISKATKSPSATPPTSRRTFNAAIATAGSFVLIPLIRGTIFSCIVYLSRAVEEDVLFLLLFTIPLSPSLLDSGLADAPQRIAKASRPRTLIPRLLVFVKTEAMTGNSSFLIVEKSRIGRIIGRLRRAASTMVCVGDSMAKCMIGSISDDD